MRIEETTASSTGVIETGPGYGFVIEPLGNGARWPLVVQKNKDTSRTDVLHSDRALYPGYFPNGLRFTGAADRSKWRITIAEAADEVIGAQSAVWRRPVQLLRTEIGEGDGWTPGSRFLKNNVTRVSELPTARTDDNGTTFDVSDFSQLLLRATFSQFDATPATVGVSLLLYAPRTNSAIIAEDEVAMGTGNDFVAGGGGFGYINLGSEFAETFGDLYRTSSVRHVGEVAVKVVTVGGQADMLGGATIELYGVP